MASSAETLTLISKDGSEINITVRVAMQSKLLKNMVNDECSSGKIPIPNVNDQTLVKVIEYCEKHSDHEANKTGDEASDSEAEKVINTWDAEFIKVDTLNTLFQILLAANYLEIKGLFDLACESVAHMMNGKEVKELRQMFGIEKDFTPQEEERLRKENPGVDF